MRALFRRILAYDPETSQMLRWVAKYAIAVGRKPKVLDVGCGYGRFLKQARSLDIDLFGVEINPETVNAMKACGFNVVTPGDFAKTDDDYDVLVMSHVIEHFDPASLLAFMDSYLDRLRVGGKLLIATPLMNSAFFNDFDHVKPYQPAAIQAVFSRANPQVQYHARNHLELRDLWFRKSYFRGHFFVANYIYPSLRTKLLRLFELFTASVVYFSRGAFGTKTGWVGVFEKVE